MRPIRFLGTQDTSRETKPLTPVVPEHPSVVEEQEGLWIPVATVMTGVDPRHPTIQPPTSNPAPNRNSGSYFGFYGPAAHQDVALVKHGGLTRRQSPLGLSEYNQRAIPVRMQDRRGLLRPCNVFSLKLPMDLPQGSPGYS